MKPSKERVETLVIARACAAGDDAGRDALTKPLARFCPSHMTPAEWRNELEAAIDALADGRLRDRDELKRRIGTHHITTWAQLADRVLPGLALGVAPDATKTLAKLSSAESWAAAIVGRERGLWTDGPLPSASAICDALAWERLGLHTKPKRLPGEVRALFLQQELSSSTAQHERLLRQLAARVLDAARSDGKALREGLVRFWLTGRELTADKPSFTTHVVELARSARDGLFGERKVFISELWRQLTASPHWSTVTLDDFKSRLLAAHAAGEVVLARADLVSAMNPELVAASETVTNGASFHFVVREP